MYRNLLICAVLAVVLPMTTGCRRGAPQAPVPELAAVTGTVTVDGQPTAGVTVIFTPSMKKNEGRSASNPAYGSTDASGKYTLKYRGKEMGVEPGRYTVTFSWIATEDGSPVPQGKTPVDVGASQRLPEKYVSAELSKEKATVEKSGGTFDFELKTK